MEMTNGRPISRSHPPLDGDWWAEGDGDTIIELQFELFFFLSLCPRWVSFFFVSSHPRYLCHSSWVTFFLLFALFLFFYLYACVFLFFLALFLLLVAR